MFENQVEQYIGKALVEEAKGDSNFLNESELAFRVTGMMYTDKVKSDGPVSLRSVKGKMARVRVLCDEKGMLLLPQVEAIADEKDIKKINHVVTGWKIATKEDINYMIETYFGGNESPEAEVETAEASTDE